MKGLRVAVKAGNSVPTRVAKTVRITEVCTDSPKIGPRAPMGMNVGLRSKENQKNIIFAS